MKSILDARIKKERIADVYSNIAPLYDLWAFLTERKARARCLQLASIRDGDDVLEVAVGTGLAFEKIVELNPAGRNEGVDLTAAMLARAERRLARSDLKSHRLRVADAYDLPFPENSFDVLVNNYMFDLLPEQDFPVVLDEFRRVLRPGGRLAMVNMTHGEHWYNNFWRRLYMISPALLGGCRSVELLPYVQRSGFDDTSREYLSQCTFPSEVVVGKAP